MSIFASSIMATNKNTGVVDHAVVIGSHENWVKANLSAQEMSVEQWPREHGWVEHSTVTEQVDVELFEANCVECHCANKG